MALTNAQYDFLMREYNAKQMKNHQIVAKKTEEIYRKIPELQELDQQVGEISSQSVEKLLDGDTSAASQLKEELKKLKEKRIALLTSFGYSLSDFEPPYECKDCKDTGFIDGKRCHCFVQASISLVYSESHLDEVVKTDNFDQFDFSYYSDRLQDQTLGMTSLESAQKAYDCAQNFVQNFSKDGGNLLLSGNAGVGKTFLSNCIAKALLDQGFSVVYFTSFQLFEILSKDIFQKDHTVKDSHSHILECDLLIIDDLGTELSNSFTTSQLFQCLNERLLRGKSTIISTNLSLQDIRDVYSERIFSRITSDFNVIKLFGDDIRIKKALSDK